MAGLPIALVAGAGPGLGYALLRHFSDNGYRAVGLSRSGEADTDLEIHSCDLTAADGSLADIISDLGTPDLVVHNPSHLVISPFLETGIDDFAPCWQAMVQSCAGLAQAVLPGMVERQSGCFITSGATASIRGGAKFAAFASAKFALRGLTQSLAREFQPKGIHVAHVILDGIIDTPASRGLHSLDPSRMMDPMDIAAAYLALANQPRSVWTHEIDLRPQSEGF